MFKKMRKVMSYLGIFLFGGIVLVIVLGLIFFPRPELPAEVSNEICEQNHIRFDTSSINKIFHEPEKILAAPEEFLSQDIAYQVLSESRERGAEEFRYSAWLKGIEKLASQTEKKREQQVPYKLYQLIMDHQGAFCQEVGRYVLSYLPAGAEIETTVYLTAMDNPVPAFANGENVVFSLSHPLFKYSTMIHETTGLSTFFNLALQELHHLGFAEIYPWPTEEELIQNEIVIDMLTSLHRESIGTYIEYELLEEYPSPFEYFLYLVDKEPIVRRYIKSMNELFAIAQTKPEPFDPAYNDTYRQIGKLCYRRKGFYIVGGYMAMRIDDELGKEALVKTIEDGYLSFVDSYNSIAVDEMKIYYK